MTRRPARLALLMLLAGLVAGCVGMPEAGPVRTEPADALLEAEAPVDFTPGGPTAGADPLEIARGFLVAMQASPLSTSVARQYLTAESSSSWVPEEGTLVYTDELRTEVGPTEVRLDLSGVTALDRRGVWLGEQGDVRLRLRLVRDAGEWRISNPPDRLIIPLTHFQSRYFQYHLYFFDKPAQVLVPEPVHVPGGAQAPTALVNGLLEGPSRPLLGVERTFLPAGVVLDDISVPVSEDGVAEVPLSDEVLDLGERALDRAFAQLAWTLGQVPGIERFRVTVDGSPLELPGLVTDMPVTGWSELGPEVVGSTQSIFGVRDGVVTAVVGGEERPVTGVFGQVDLGVESIGVSLRGDRVAAVTGSGTVLVGPRAREPAGDPRAEDARPVVTGADEPLAPAWDLHGNVWLIDRGPAGGARVRVVRDRTVTSHEVQGVTGEDVRSFALSRDGTRLAAEVTGRARDRVVVARIRRDDTGRVRGLLPAASLGVEALGVVRVRDLDFRTPAGVAVLAAPSAGTSRVLLADVDGSSARTGVPSEIGAYPGAADRLVTSPSPGAGLLVQTRDGRLFVLAASGRWAGVEVEPGIGSPTFVG
ncbi:MAG TPA: LpqB family beta-propeller domain-containing protein [Nocardioides sp.]|nr:LpqB family beta-propeller domain-containing protein [Nocardioides sp.]